ncbi:hypothetical protein BaRGS_00010664 [Batillaria attramentaria]|uniref:MACPF domain-containing protein n=1 Tax=Batillaria attramentaria TaxID=370345 RepID=A0ABD0LFV6_9CAEN
MERLDQILRDNEDMKNRILRDNEDMKNRILRDNEDVKNRILRDNEDMKNRIEKPTKQKVKRLSYLVGAALLLLILCLCGLTALAVFGSLQLKHVPKSDQSTANDSSVSLLVAKSSRLAAVPVDVVGGVGVQPQLPLGFQNWEDYAGSNIGIRNDYLLQECTGPQLKRSFPDMDYALLGYNVLKGYPLAVGHDPGFTLPIFSADYRAGHMTADCRYSVPQGIVLIPDVSCVTSFSSSVVQTSYELSKSLSVSAHASGGGWGVSFSASAGYRESSSQMSTGESWIVKLNQSEVDENVYANFFEKYGTHFLTDVTFGASFTYEHTMSAKSHKSFTEKGVNVAVSASYSGAFSVGGGFNMDSSQKQAASEFQKSVTTRTITIGAAPPANGDAMTWASTVKESPVPVKYSLASIEELFSENFMGDGYMQRYNIDYQRIKERIADSKKLYCERLKSEGLVDDCAELSSGFVLKNTELIGNPDRKKLSSFGQCIDECYKRSDCVAVDFCVDCRSQDSEYNSCHMYGETDLSHGKAKGSHQTTIILPELEKQLVLNNTAVRGVRRSLANATEVDTVRKCFSSCLMDVHCVAFTFCQCPNKQKCTLYSETQMSLFTEDGTIPKLNALPTTTSTAENGTQTPRDNTEAYSDKNDTADRTTVESPSQTTEDVLSWLLLQARYPKDFAIPIYGILWHPVAVIVFLTNSLICIVLLKKHMRTAANILLVAIAISDMLTGLSPVPFLINFLATDRFWEFVPYECCHMEEVLTQKIPTIFHTASIWLTLGLGVQRYISVCHPFKARFWCSVKKTVQGILVTFTLAFLSHLCRFCDDTTFEVELPSAVTPNKTVTSCYRVWND